MPLQQQKAHFHLETNILTPVSHERYAVLKNWIKNNKMLQMYFIELSLEIVAEIADSRLDIFIFMFCISLIFFVGGVCF